MQLARNISPDRARCFSEIRTNVRGTKSRFHVKEKKGYDLACLGEKRKALALTRAHDDFLSNCYMGAKGAA